MSESNKSKCPDAQVKLNLPQSLQVAVSDELLDALKKLLDFEQVQLVY